MTAEKEPVFCFHCGDPCDTTIVKKGDKSFCCRGCQTVYEILSEKEMVEYYEIEKTPGVKVEEKVFSDFAYLDIPEIKEELLTYFDGETERLSLNIPGIHCASCIWLLENLNQLNEGIIRSEVNFLKKEVSLQYRPSKISLRQVAELLDSIGYKPLIELREKEKSKANRRRDLSYIYKLGISGFAFGNIMLLSFPEYFSGGMYDDGNFGTFFGYLNLLLATPVFLYCSSDYFISAWKGIRHKYLNIDVPIALGIFVLYTRSAYEVVTTTGAGYFDSMTGLVFFLIVGRWFQNRTYQALSFERDYRSYFPLGVNRIRNGKRESVVLKDVEIGDELEIHHGEIIPADAVLLSSKAEIDYSFVTGESDPVSVEKGSRIFAGGRQTGGQILIEVEKAFSQSYLMQLWKQDTDRSSQRRDLSRLIDKVSQYFTAIVLLIAVVTGIYWWTKDVYIAFHAITSVLIVACPCALALTIPFTFGNGLKLMEKAGLYLKDARFIEVLASVNTIVFDKTGTITSQASRQVDFNGGELSDKERSMARSLVANSAHALSKAIFNYLEGQSIEPMSNFEEETGKGLSGMVQGVHVAMGSSTFIGTEDVEGTAVFLKIEGKVKGYFSIGNEYRSGLKQLVDKLSKRFTLKVITGDTEGEKKKLEQIFPRNTELCFRMDPFAKREFIKEAKLKGAKVLMIGDGLNDAGAIKESNVGMSISDDIYGFLPSCDAILEAKRFDKLQSFLRFTSSLRKLVIVGFIISFAYNLIGMVFAVSGQLSPVFAAILMPISSITVVSFAIFSSRFAAGKSKIF